MYLHLYLCFLNIIIIQKFCFANLAPAPITQNQMRVEQFLDDLREARLFTEIYDSIGNLFGKQMDNIQQYRQCKTNYPNERLTGIRECFNILLGGLTPEEQKAQFPQTVYQKTGVSSIEDFYNQEKISLQNGQGQTDPYSQSQLQSQQYANGDYTQMQGEQYLYDPYNQNYDGSYLSQNPTQYYQNGQGVMGMNGFSGSSSPGTQPSQLNGPLAAYFQQIQKAQGQNPSLGYPQQAQNLGGLDPQQGQNFGQFYPQQGQNFGQSYPQQGQNLNAVYPQQGQTLGGNFPQQGQAQDGFYSQQGQNLGGFNSQEGQNFYPQQGQNQAGGYGLQQPDNLGGNYYQQGAQGQGGYGTNYQQGMNSYGQGAAQQRPYGAPGSYNSQLQNYHNTNHWYWQQ